MRARAAALLLAAVAAFGIAPAVDRLRLTSGGVIEAETWRIEGNTVLVETPNGTVSLPRSLVVGIESDSAPARAAPPATSAAPSLPPGARDAETRAETAATIAKAEAALRARDFETASRHFRRLMEIDPERADARAGYAVAEMALGRDPVALAVVLDGIARSPDAADLHELLGDLRDREERVDEALASWREAFRIAPNDRLREKIVKGEREQEAGRDYAFAAAAHFTLRHDGELDADLAAVVLDHLEAAYAETTGAFRHAPGQPITVILYPRREFHDVTQAGADVGGLYDGKIRVPLGGIRVLDERARRLLVHELTHAVVHSKSRGNCPRWLHEGLAQMREPRPLSEADRAAVRKAVTAGDPATWHERAFSYPAALALTLWLDERRGFDGIVWVLERLGAGDDLDAALTEVYGETYAALTRRWAASLAEDAP